MKLNKILLLSVLLSLASILSGEGKKVSWPAAFVDIGILQAEKLLKSGNVILLDVRTDREVKAGHIKGAQQINYNSREFEALIKKLDRSQNYIVYCAVGGRSRRAVDLMEKLKFISVYNLKGGYGAWSEKD